MCYYQNNLKRKNGGFYYSLTFSVRFPYDCDTVYIAHCYPYTYTQLQEYLLRLEMDNALKSRFQRKTVCQTIAGNNCDYVIIADFANGKEKKGIFLTSRVHPGETMASYLIEYIIDFLLGDSAVAKHLREHFIIKIVPMLNIDGVINGNYRCNLAACDLNRTWIDPNKKLHPTIYATKQLIRRMKEERDLVMVCDFHGHSRKKNIFIYGCGKDNSKKEQVFSGLMRNNCPVFKFKDCSFVLQKDKEGTARVHRHLRRSRSGRSSTSPTASRWSSRSAAPTSGPTTSSTSCCTPTGRLPTPSASRSTTTATPTSPRSRP